METHQRQTDRWMKVDEGHRLAFHTKSYGTFIGTYGSLQRQTDGWRWVDERSTKQSVSRRWDGREVECALVGECIDGTTTTHLKTRLGLK